jgi:hypothetical protein
MGAGISARPVPRSRYVDVTVQVLACVS